MKRPPRVLRSRQAGVALVAVLWMVAALALLAAALAATSRADLRSAQAARAFAEAAALGDAAIQLAALELRSMPSPPARPGRESYEIDGRRVDILVSPVGGFVDLNRAPESLLHDLFRHGAGVDEALAETLAQRIIDWRDADRSALPHGAEDDAYAAAGVRYRTRGGPFESPEDLLQVLGLSFDVYDKVTAFVTVYGRAPRVDPLAAASGLLRVLARGDDAHAGRVAAARDSGESIIDMSAFVQEHLQRSSSGTRFRIEARIGDDGARRLARVRWIDLANKGAGGLPWRTLRAEPVRAIDPGASHDGA
jgi:general secretion pathway protein K